jgi:hypothetical protein
MEKHHNTRHGMDGTPIYRIWIDMRRRCHQPHRPDYHRYGGRGITVCERWRVSPGGFENFLDDMGDRPSPKHTLERLKNEEGYSKQNCIWANKKQQGANMRTNRHVTVDGIKITVTQAAEKYGIHCATVFSRLNRGWNAERAVKEPLKRAGPRARPRSPPDPTSPLSAE